jgi:AraC-like DNA-binding protein
MQSQLYLWPRWVLYLGRSFDSHTHTHHAVQLSIGLDGPLRLNKKSDHEVLLPAVIIDSETEHSLQVEGQWVASIYLEPESEDYERLVDYYSGASSGGFSSLAIPAKLKAGFSRLLAAELDPTLAKQLLQQLIGQTTVHATQVLDPRVIKVLKHLELSQGLNVPLEQLAKHVSLSSTRLAHLFRQQIGTPIRRYVLWQKLRMAARVAAQGQSLIYAAHEAGFSDSAHLTHSFQKLFGINPSFLFGQQHQIAMYVE